MKHVALVISLWMLVGYTNPAFAFDSSEYRQNTYGPPNRYADPTRPLNSNGSGTLGDPWNLTQAMQLAVAGDVVGILPGVSVQLPAPNGRIPAFNPTNQGTSTNRIVFVTRYAAVALPNVATNSNRTQLRHAGTRATANGDYENGNGGPAYGSYMRNYVTFDGFFVDMAQAQPRGDSGVIRVESATGVHFRNFEIKGTRTNMQSNPIMYRPQNAVGTVLSNFRAYDFSNDTTNSTVPQAALFSDQYGDQNFLIEHFEIRNTEHGIFLKGTAPAGVNFNYGTIQYGKVSDVFSCIRFNDLHASNLTTVQYNVCYDVSDGAGIFLSSETSAARNLLIHHNTVARVNSLSMNTSGGFASRSSGIGSNVTIRDNLIDVDNGPYGHQMDFGAISALPAISNYNAFYKNGATMSWAYNGVQYNSLSAWRSASSREANGLALTTSPFIDRTNGNFRIVPGHQAQTASSSGGEVGAYASNQVIGVDVTGSTGTSDMDPPVAPVGLRIQ